MIKDLRTAIIKAWDITQPCPDGEYSGNQFCPNCLVDNLFKLLDEQARIIEALGQQVDAIIGEIKPTDDEIYKEWRTNDD